jgi:hypothetical protein
MNQREDRAQEAGAGQAVPSGAPGGAGDGHDATPPPAAQPLTQGERDWTAAHADPPGGPDAAPAPRTQ